jgi:hypothetical protein
MYETAREWKSANENFVREYPTIFTPVGRKPCLNNPNRAGKVLGW